MNSTDVVIRERLTQPSMVTPTLFVGLGGCGLKMVKRIKEHLASHPDYDERFKDLTKFAGFDTNINDLEKVRALMDDVFLISDFEKEDYAKLATGQLFLEADDYFTQWVHDDYRFRAGDTAGAGQIRIESRLGLYYQLKHRTVLKRLRALLEQLKDHSHGHRRLSSDEIRIVLCYSVAGGTGSGAHLPMAYVLRDLASELGKPRLFGAAVLSSVFEDKAGRNKDGIFANGYAALKETEHLMRLGAPDGLEFPQNGQTFHYNPADETKRKVHTKPFEFVYIIDRPEKFTVDDVIGAAADGLYHQFYAPNIFGEQAGDYDNYTQHQRFLVPSDFENKGVPGFTSFYGSFGSASLLVPTDGLLDYCAKAAAQDILRLNFVDNIPSGDHFQRILSNREEFDTVTIDDGGTRREVHTSKLQELSANRQREARDHLFVKRIRLLAREERAAGSRVLNPEYNEIWRHGHGAAYERVARDPSLPGEPARNDGEASLAYGWSQLRSLVGALEQSIGYQEEGEYSLESAGIYAGAEAVFRNGMRRAMTNISSELEKGNTAGEVWSSLGRAHDRALTDALESMERDSETAADVLGFKNLVSLRFLVDRAKGLDLRAQRYAFLMLKDHVAFQEAMRSESNSAEPRAPEFSWSKEGETGSKGFWPLGSKKMSDAEVAERNQGYAQELQSAIEARNSHARTVIAERFFEHMKALHSAITEHARRLAEMEQDVGPVDSDRARELRRLLVSGSVMANKYILDGEALQMENGRRLWDYYYQDKVAGRGEFKLNNSDVAAILGQPFDQNSTGADRVTSREMLNTMLASLESHARRVLKADLEGIPGHRDKLKRDGYTLELALEDEIVYRALHLTNSGEGEIGQGAIRAALGRFNALPPEEQKRVVDLDGSIFRDYLRDKVSRVVNERAQLLCYYDDTKDQQGGVRPCHVFLASVNADFARSRIGDILKSGDFEGLRWCEDESVSHRQVVFYRAVLNVPLYVFGRMEAMRNDYHAFKNATRRSKVLHIDKNWEDTLPDLDPQAAIDHHTRAVMRSKIIGFSSLLTVHELAEEGTDNKPRISQTTTHGARRQDAYWILRPALPSPSADGMVVAPREEESGELVNGYQRLGSTLRESVTELRRIMKQNPVVYQTYYQMINAVSNGLLPELLELVCKQAIRWRQLHDSWREKRGGGSAQGTGLQRARLEDLEDAYTRLVEALQDLKNELGDRLEERIADDAIRGKSQHLPREEELQRVRKSLEVLDKFDKDWQQILNPEMNVGAPEDIFKALFGAVTNGGNA